MSVLLERCLTHFKETRQYDDDPRLLEIWLKFVRVTRSRIKIAVNFRFGQSASGLWVVLSCICEKSTRSSKMKERFEIRGDFCVLTKNRNG